jgi:hypothetical protein
MSTPNEPTADTFRLQALAKTVSDILRQRFGNKEFYTADEVEVACNQCDVPASSREYAVAMFVEPELTKGFLEKLGSSKTALELRKFLAAQIFFYYLPNVSYESSTNDFHHTGDSHGHGSGGIDGSGSGHGGHGGHDGGHGGHDSGGDAG